MVDFIACILPLDSHLTHTFFVTFFLTIFELNALFVYIHFIFTTG